MIVVLVVCARPRHLEVLNQAWNLRFETANILRHGSSKPVRVTPVRNLERPNLRKEPRDEQSNRRREDQPRWSSEGGLAECDQCCWNVARLCLSKWFDCAYVSCKEGKHCHTDSSLPW
jgi:hypothetical protein